MITAIVKGSTMAMVGLLVKKLKIEGEGDIQLTVGTGTKDRRMN